MSKVIYHIIARGILFNDNKVLLAHQMGADNTFLPGGHYDMPGECLTDALARELREELGVTVSIGPYLGAVEHHYIYNNNNHQELNHIFLMKHTDVRNLNLTSQEDHLEFTWHNIYKLKDVNL